MNHTGRTNIEINGKTYLIKFGMGALMHFSEPFGGDLEKTLMQLQQSGIHQIKALGKFIYSALYVDSLYKEVELDLTLFDVIDWIDTSPVSEIERISTVMSTGLTQITDVATPKVKSVSSKKK